MSNEMVPLGDALAEYFAKHATPPKWSFIKFNRDGEFVLSETGAVLKDGTQCVCLFEQAQVGWIKFNGPGNQPDRHMGPVAQGFVVPPRESLGDNDEAHWPAGLNGQPADPWIFQINLPLQNTETGDLYLFTTSSWTGRRAVDDLLRRCAKDFTGDMLPIIRLTRGSYQTKKFGKINVPQFDFVSSAAKGDYKAVTVSDDMNDEVPF